MNTNQSPQVGMAVMMLPDLLTHLVERYYQDGTVSQRVCSPSQIPADAQALLNERRNHEHN